MLIPLIKHIFLSLLIVLFGRSIFSQDVSQDQKIISMYGIDKMSMTGQDTLVYYFTNKFDDIFVSRAVTFPEIKTKLTVFFRDRLSVADYEILEESLEDVRLKLRDTFYCHALQCQRNAIDSLLLHYEDTLQWYSDLVFLRLKQDQIATIQQLFHQSISTLESKKQEFLDHELQISEGERTCGYDYMDYGFDLMRRIPCANYYNLLGVNMSGLSFVDAVGLDMYYQTYAEFEIALTRVLALNGCKAHAAIPFFVEFSDENSITTYRKRNALFYIVAQREDSIVQEKQIPQFSSFDTIRIESWNNGNLVLEEIIDETVLMELGFELTPSLVDEEGAITFYNPVNIEMAGFVLLTSAEERLKTIRDFNNRIRKQRVQKLVAGNHVLYYELDTEEMRDASKEVVHIDGVVLSGKEMVGLFLMGTDPKVCISRLHELLAAIKL